MEIVYIGEQPKRQATGEHDGPGGHICPRDILVFHERGEGEARYSKGGDKEPFQEDRV